MNILIVDDQKTIVDSIERELKWDEVGITNTYKAYSAMEAKLVLMNFEIDILLTDIEMPEEDGISLFRWTKENFPETLGIILTSHADFGYAKDAIKLGCFDYILQPAHYSEIEAVLKRAVEKAKKQVRIKRLEKATEIIVEQRDAALDMLITKAIAGNENECKNIYNRLRDMYVIKYENCVFRALRVEIVHIDNRNNKWDSELIQLVFRNVLEELFGAVNAKVSIGKYDRLHRFLIFIAMEENALSEERWRNGIEEFTNFFNGRMSFRIAVYPQKLEIVEYRHDNFISENSSGEWSGNNKPGIYWEEEDKDPITSENEERMKLAQDYIKSNISKNLTRLQVAEYVHLNEEYFSRQFKKYTGYTFKEYDAMVHMETAKWFLEQTKLSISIVALKVGYDNFSHFSKVFKKYTNMSPQEYRKEKTGK